MAIDYERRWPALFEFMCVTFHEEMGDDFPANETFESARLAVADFVHTQEREQVERVRSDLVDFLARVSSESEFEAAADEMYCRWDFSPYGVWFRSLLAQFDSFLRVEAHPTPQVNTAATQRIADRAAERGLPFGGSDRLLIAIVIGLLVAALGWRVSLTTKQTAVPRWTLPPPVPTPNPHIAPAITNFEVTPTDSNTRRTWRISYTVRDVGGSGLKRVELWRLIEGTAKWVLVREVELTGRGPSSGSFADAPPSGTYWYGVHAVDSADNWSVEPNPPGPSRVVVGEGP